MNSPHYAEFYNAFTQKSTELTLKYFGCLGTDVPSYKCHKISACGLDWACAVRIYLVGTYIGIDNYGVDHRFKRKFHYEKYDHLNDLIDAIIPYITNIVNNHDGWRKRARDMKKYHMSIIK